MFCADEAVSAGMSLEQLRGSKYQRLSRGIFRPYDVEIAPLELFRAFSQSAPNAHLSHSTAAQIWGLWLPARYESCVPVHLSRTGTERVVPRARNVIGHWSSAAPEDIREIGGMRLTSPAWTWTELAGLGLGLEDLVAAGDALLQDPNGPPRPAGVIGTNPLASLGEIAELLERRSGFRGRAQALRALELMRPNVDSRPESVLRQRIHGRGFPDMEVNPVLALGDGRTIRPDLADRMNRIAVQYEGRHHNEDRQIGRDIRRDFSLAQIDWLTVRANRDFFTASGEREFFVRLRTAYEVRGVRI